MTYQSSCRSIALPFRHSIQKSLRKTVWSDNGTNFVGADKELRESIEKWNANKITAELAHTGIKWSFNPPSAPHQDGI